MLNNIHTDYEIEDLPVAGLIQQSQMLKGDIEELIKDCAQEDESRQWLGTFKINGQRYQLQLVMTNIDSHYVDEN